MASIVVVTRFLPHYRLVFFENLRRELGERGHRLVVAYGRPLGEVGEPAWAVRLPSVAVGLKLRALRDTAVFVRGVVPVLRRERPEVVVVEDIGGIPTNLIAARHCRAKGIPYLVWGLGRIPQKEPSRLRTVLGPLIRSLYGRADGFLGYSSHASRVYAEYGKPCFVVLNASRKRPDDDETRLTREAIDRRGGPKLVLVTIGRLLPHKRVDVLLRAIHGRSPEQIELHVIGEGPEKARLEHLAAELGLGRSVVFHGGVYEEQRKAELLRASDVGVLPGRGGLAIQELMWHGLPVITGPADGTEEDLIDKDRGVRIPRMPSAEDLSAALDGFRTLDARTRRTLARNALTLVLERANVEAMTGSYVEALESTARGAAGRRVAQDRPRQRA